MEIQLWREILHPYEQAVAELMVKFRSLREEYRRNNQYSPIENVYGRVKSVSSILEKMQRKNVPFERMEAEIEDIAGIRIICQFVEDIEAVARVIESRTDMRVISLKDYLTNKKKSGYRSFHVIISYTVQTIHGPKELLAEIQIRTMAMNFWATTEHSLQYKYKGRIPEHISEQLQEIADAIFTLDTAMGLVRSEIIDSQLDSQLQTELVRGILTSIENLYRVESAREVEKIQTEFYEIFKSGDLDELRRFQRQLDIIAEGARAQSVEDKLTGPDAII